MRRDNGPEDLLAKQSVSWIAGFDERRLDEVSNVSFGYAALQNPGVLFRVAEIFADFRERLLIDDRAHEIAEIADVAHLDLFHDRDGPVSHFTPDGLRNVDAARSRALLSLVLEAAPRNRDANLLR